MLTYTNFFNGRTKTIQTLNMLLFGIWLWNLLLIYLGLEVEIQRDLSVPESLKVFNILGFIFGLFGYFCKEQNCERCLGFRSASLLLGSIFHIITASTFLGDYPPLRVGTASEIVFAFIFFISGIYCLTAEGKYDRGNQK